MLLAAKFEEIYAPNVDDFVYISDNTYDHAQVLSVRNELKCMFSFHLSILLFFSLSPSHFLILSFSHSFCDPAPSHALRNLISLRRARRALVRVFSSQSTRLQDPGTDGHVLPSTLSPSICSARLLSHPPLRSGQLQ